MIRKFGDIKPAIDPTCFIVDSALIVGDVHMGAYSSVWFNAVVRGDVNYIRIGRRTNIQDNSVLHVTHDTHPLVLGDDITVGHSVTLHGCVIKDRCLIGMGATLLDGSVIGSDSVVGAGALVTEGTIIPSGSLAIGLPARVKRVLTDDEIKGIRQSALNYIRYADDYGRDVDV